MAARKRLTDRAIGTKHAGLHSEGDVPGLMLQVTPGGARTWILRTMIQGKRRDMGLGGWPTVSLKEAREKARKFRKIAREGGNPFIERDKAKKPAPSFSEACEKVHAEHSRGWKNKKHATQWINTLREYAIPVLGKLRVDAVTSGDIMRALGPIWLEKPETARRVLQRVSTVLLWAKGHGFRGDSPSDEIAAVRKSLPKQNVNVVHHAALPHADVADLISKLRAAPTSDAIKLGLEFLILTATRTGEVLGATWPEFNLAERLWTIPANRMKAEREHQVPLTDRCIEILTEARKLSDRPNGHVFPGTVSGKPLSNMAFLMLLRRMGLNITAHGFRASFRIWAAETTNYPREVAEAALAHKLADKTEASYQRSTYLTERKDGKEVHGKRWRLMEDWARYAAKRSAQVIRIAHTGVQAL